jgi:hypothetical protein
LDDKQAARLFTGAMTRFSSLAGWSLGLLLITGAYGVWLHIHSWGGLTSTYGMALVTKLALVAPMIGLGALGRYHVLPELQRSIGESSRAGRLDRAGEGRSRSASPGELAFLGEGDRVGDSISGLRFIVFECVLAVGVLAIPRCSPDHAPT